MAYIDPIEMLQLQVQPGQSISPEELRRAKRKLLAEFELQGGVTITYRGQQIDKAVALAALEQLEDQATQYALIRIHTNPGLKRVLQNLDERALLALPPAEKLGPPDFLKFCSGILAPVFNEILNLQIKKKDWPLVARLLNRLDLIDEWDHAAAVKGFVSHLRLNLIRLKELPADSETLQTWDEKILYHSGMMIAFNRLPKQFQNLRNQYAEALQDIALAMAEKLQRNKDAYRVISAGASLTLDVNVANRIQHNQLWIWNRVKREQETTGQSTGGQRQSTSSTHSVPGSGNRSQVWGTVIGIIVVLIFLGRLINSFNRSTPTYENYYRYTPPRIEVPDIKMHDFLQDSGRQAFSAESLRISTPNRYHATNRKSISEARFDTIFFKDLIFYENLNAFTKRNEGGQGEEIRPRTGQDLYKKVWKPGKGIYDASAKTVPVILRNENTSAVILFFETMSTGEVLHSYYLPSGREYRCNELPGTFFKVRSYQGDRMEGGAFRYKGEQLPAFTVSAKKVKVENDDLDGKKGVVTLFNFGFEDFQTHKIEPNKVTFTAEGILKTGD